MKKKLLTLFIVLLSLIAVMIPVLADQTGNVVLDDSLPQYGIYFDNVNEFNEKALETYFDYDLDVYFVMDYSMDASSSYPIIDYAENFFDNNGFGDTNVVLVINRNYYYLYSEGVYADRINGRGQDVWNAMDQYPDYDDKLMAYLAEVVNLCGFTSNSIIDEKSRIPTYSNSQKVIDIDNLLTSSQEDSLTAKIKDINSRLNFDIAVVVADTLNELTPQQYADDFFDYNNYGIGAGKDGALILLCLEDRDWHISTHGYGITAITDYSINYIRNNYIGSFSSGNYYEGFNDIIDYIDKCVSSAKQDKPIDVNNPVKEFSSGNIFACLGGSTLLTAIVSAILKGRMKTVRSVNHADNYVVNNSLEFSPVRERFIRTSISKTKIQHYESSGSSGGGGGSSTHSSSSGSSHGGGGGKF